MSAGGTAVFDTPIGVCGIAWAAAGLRGVQLPGAGADATRARLAAKFADLAAAVPPPAVARAIERLLALLGGARDDLRDIMLDLEGVPDFDRRVYATAREVPPGDTITYGELAQRLGDAQLARAVGQALGANRFAIVVPCHRVLAAHGGAGGFSAPGGLRTKLRLLEIERARFGAAPGLF